MRYRREHWLLLFAAAAMVGAFVFLVLSIHAAATTPVARLDRIVLVNLNGAIRGHPSAIFFWKVITTVGGPTGMYVVIGIAAVVLVCRHQPGAAALAVMITATAGVSSRVLKFVVDRPRPTLATPVANAGGLSFPSGHALTSFVAAGVLVLLVLPALNGDRFRALATAAAIVVIMLVGFSRLILGVHYLSDVIAGWLAGAIWLIALVIIQPRVRHPTPAPARG